MADKKSKLTYTIEINDKGKVKIDRLTKGFVNASTAVKNLNKDLIQQGQIMQDNNRVNQNMIDKTGLAGATLVELGRTISDSNYGIRGMANNLSQLSTLMITLISTTGGVVNGFKALLSAFMGPLGIIIAFQAVIALIERQDMEAQKLKRTTESLGAGVANTAGNFEIYIRKLQDSNTSQEQQIIAIQKLNKEFPDFIKSLKESGTSMDDIKNSTLDATKAINEYRRSIVALAYSEAARKKIKDLAAKEMDVEKAAIDELKEGGMTLDRARTLWAKREEIRQNEQLSDAEKRIAINKIFRDEIVKGSEEFSKFNLDRAADIIDSLDAENISIQEQINLLVKRVILEEDRANKGLSRDKKFKASQLDFEKEIIKSEGRITASLISNNELRVKEEFDNIRELAVLKQKDFAEAQQRRVDSIKDEKLKAEAQEKVNKEIAASEESLVKYIIQLRAERDRTINQMRIDDLSNASALMEKEQGIRKQAALEFNSFLALTNKQRFDADIELEKLKTENIIIEIEKQIAAAQIAGEDTRGLEEKLDRVREQLYQRQVERGVKLIHDESKRINGIIKATQGAFSQLSNVFTSYTDARIAQLERERNYILNSESLTKAAQQERIKDIEARELQAQKNKIRLERELFTIKQSLLIAEQVMKAKAVVLENKTKILELYGESAIQAGKAKMSIGTFVAKGGLNGLATYAITIGGLLASIFAARKKAEAQLRSLGAPSSGGAGAGGGVEAPDFNVVGASPESQLAQSVMAQQQKPLRAFVVNKDIKTAEELERNTVKALG